MITKFCFKIILKIYHGLIYWFFFLDFDLKLQTISLKNHLHFNQQDMRKCASRLKM